MLTTIVTNQRYHMIEKKINIWPNVEKQTYWIFPVSFDREIMKIGKEWMMEKKPSFDIKSSKYMHNNSRETI